MSLGAGCEHLWANWHKTNMAADETCVPLVSLIRLSLAFENSTRRGSGRRGLVVTHCHHSILCRRSREASAANRRHYRDATLIFLLPNLTFQSDCFVNITKVNSNYAISNDKS